ncbi:MAG TPA: DUF2239 family protein [Armatimonadota bacterium]|jgi:hypothetical protein
MNEIYPASYTAFAGVQRIASGELAQVALQTKQVIEQGTLAPVLIFQDTTSEQVELDFRGTDEDVLQRVAAILRASAPVAAPEPAQKTPGGPGRPKLGVVAREVTLLPRHWAWLNSQPGGASVALRKLVELARRANEQGDRLRLAQEATYRFMSVMAGDLPGFEEATRALFAKNGERFDALIAPWPIDVREHTRRLAAIVFQAGVGEA